MRIDRADSEAELLGAPSSSAEIVKVVAGDFEVRLAKSAAEIDAAQALRYRVFYEEMTAHPTPEMAARRRDFDAFDEVCDHLLVLDRRRGDGPEGDRRHLSPDPPFGGGQDGPLLFVRRIRRPADDRLSGRGPGSSAARASPRTRATPRPCRCCGAASRSTAFHYNIQVMFGCASQPGTDPSQHAQAMCYLYHHHLAPPEMRVRALRRAAT